MTDYDLFAAQEAEVEPSPVQLRDYQERAVAKLRANIRSGVVRQVLCAPTGAGKTVIAAHIIRQAHLKRRRAIFVVDRIALVNQTSKVFDRYGIPHGIIQGNHWRWQPWQRIQVASADTLAHRGWPENPDLIVVDECHTYRKVVVERIARGDCPTLGLTATPFPEWLGKVYDGIVSVATTHQLMREGYLCGFRVFAPSDPDLTGAKRRADGEITDGSSATAMRPLIGDCVAEYLKYGANKKFLCFGSTIAHCEELAAAFMAAGVPVALYTSDTDKELRDEIEAEFRKPDSHYRGLISVAALTKGFDVEDVEVLIIARVLRKSLTEHIQMIGRGLRIDPRNPGKVCLILDHARNMEHFWADMEEFFEYGATELPDGKPQQPRKAREKDEPPALRCPSCHAVHKPARYCPNCGHEYPRRSKIVHQAGTLSEFTGFEVGSREDRESWYRQFLGYVAERRAEGKQMSTGWAAHAYRRRFGEWPSRTFSQAPISPSDRIRKWIVGDMIRYARGRAAGERRRQRASAR